MTDVLFSLAYWPDRHLYMIPDRVTSFDNIPEVAAVLMKTMLYNRGIGLSANQCKLNMRMFSMHVGHVRKVFVNPFITARSEEKCVQKEGCLSFPIGRRRPIFNFEQTTIVEHEQPTYQVEMERSKEITIEAQDIYGEPLRLDLEGLAAVCAQHEMDHLDGRTFADHLGKLRQRILKNKVASAVKAIKSRTYNEIKRTYANVGES